MNLPLPAFDRARIDDLVRGTATAPAEFLAEFRRTIELDIGKLLEAAKDGELAQVVRMAHRIEGAGRMIGAVGLARACSAVAAAAKAGGAGEIGAALAGFIEARRALYAFMGAPDPGGLGAGPPALASGPEEGPFCAGLVFLVVEDHDFQRAMILRLLRRLGASEIHGFADGAEALQVARSLPPAGAILVLDLAMPSLGGIEVAQIVGAEQLPVAIVLHSAQSPELLAAAIAEARSGGATVLGAIGKPLTPAMLAPLVARHRELLAGKAPTEPASP